MKRAMEFSPPATESWSCANSRPTCRRLPPQPSRKRRRPRVDCMATFAELVASRRTWIDNELKPWCAQATVAQLKLAELEWLDIAGRVDPEVTLWAWAWSRFPELVNRDLARIDETRQV